MTRGTRLQLRTEALRHNARRARALAAGADLYAMVKANGYGHGLVEVARALRQEVDGFGVAMLDEAVLLRDSGIEAPVTLLEGCFDATEWTEAAALGLEVVIHTPEQLGRLREAALARSVDVWLKLETGMHRLGLSPDALEDALRALAALPVRVCGLMTHFACADQQDDPLSADQLRQLRELAAAHRLPWCAANSAALFRYPDAVGARVRPGIMLYGASPLEESSAAELQLRVTQRFAAPLIAIQDVPTGETVGYGGSWRARRPARVGVVAVGYGDGYPRHAGNGAPVAVGSKTARTVGRVSMDMITIDLTDLPQARVGDEVELWGDLVPVDEVARFCGTISYELFCQVTTRPERQVLDGEA